METKDKKRFAELMAGMGEVFQKQLSDPLLKIYWNALQRYSIEEIETAFGNIVSTRTITGTLPLPAEIINAISGNPDENAEIAWRTLVKTIEDHGYYDSVQFEDGAIGEAVKLLGGWMRITGDNPDWNENQLQWRRKEFITIYKSMAKQNCQPSKLIGFHEGNNHGNYQKFIPETVYVGSNGNKQKFLAE